MYGCYGNDDYIINSKVVVDFNLLINICYKLVQFS